jgi:hypothetical protein
MLKRLRMPSPATSLAFIALIVAFTGGAYAAKKIGTKQLKINAVTRAKIAPNAVNGTKVQDAGLSGADLGANSVGGAQINEAGLAGINAAQLAGTAPEAFGSGVVMGKIHLESGTLNQYASPAGLTDDTTINAVDRLFITVPNQIVRDFTIVDQDLPGVPTANLDVRLHWQGNVIGSCSITSSQFPGCSFSTDGVIGDVGVNSLVLELQASNGTFFNTDRLVFAYRLTPAP